MKIKLKKNCIFGICLFWLLPVVIAPAKTGYDQIKFDLVNAGILPVWLVAGTFDQPIIGFHEIGDADNIGESSLEPFEGKIEKDAFTESGETVWLIKSCDSEGYLDFNEIVDWQNPGKVPAKIRSAKAAYAFTSLESDNEIDACLLLGSNAGIKVYLNQQLVYHNPQQRAAQIDDDSVRVHLKKGQNTLLIKVWNSHYNYYLPFFNGIDWGWGFYARLVGIDSNPLNQVKSYVSAQKTESDFKVNSTFFFRNSGKNLKQRSEVQIKSRIPASIPGKLLLRLGQKSFQFEFTNIHYGWNRFEVDLPEVESRQEVIGDLEFGSVKIRKSFFLDRQPKYILHLMMLAHMDIGYTDPQPLVVEKHLNTLDQVIEFCQKNPDFCWTIETVWILEQYELGRSREKFEQLIELIKNGRIAVSPVYSNPFTGWIDEGELFRSFEKAGYYKNKYGLDFKGAVYNDVPGLNWTMPQVFNNLGIQFLACGLNEIYNDYALQRAIPKVFLWQGNDGNKIITYRNEAYDEGRQYGLEKSLPAIEYRLQERLNILNSWGYPYDLVLINTSLIDNGGIPVDQYLHAREWNQKFAYPKFVISNLNRFAAEFLKISSLKLPAVNGDWTSDWDILYQGEAQRNIDLRQTQNNILTAEKFSTIGWLMNDQNIPFEKTIREAYQSLLMFTGHGSGLEAGLGSEAENRITMMYREYSIREAQLKSNSAKLRALHRISVAEETWGAEGLLIFNPLNWRRDIPVEVHFPAGTNREYAIVDLVSKQNLAVFNERDALYFIARDLPAIGYKKYLLNPLSEKLKTEGNLKIKNNSIENEFYQIIFSADQNINTVESIIDKRSGVELLGKADHYPHNQPLREILYEEPYNIVPMNQSTMEMIDQRPVRVMAIIRPAGHLFQELRYTLWENLDQIDIQQVINLEKLIPPTNTEEYGLPFSFHLQHGQAVPEILGGLIRPDRDRFPGMQNEAFSIRRVIGIYNDEYTISLASPDCRVIRLKDTGPSESPVLIANLVNNFPLRWNRNEINEGLLKFRFYIQGQQTTWDPASLIRFGWECATPSAVTHSLYRSEVPEKSYFKIIGDPIILLSMRPDLETGEVTVHFQNPDGIKKARAQFTSDHFLLKDAYTMDFFGQKGPKIPLQNNEVFIELKPHQIASYSLKIESKDKP